MICPKCSHEWEYKGKSVLYVTCPNCYRKIHASETPPPTTHDHSDIEAIKAARDEHLVKVADQYIRDEIATEIAKANGKSYSYPSPKLYGKFKCDTCEAEFETCPSDAMFCPSCRKATITDLSEIKCITPLQGRLSAFINEAERKLPRPDSPRNDKPFSVSA
jgi:hypothetical protein